MKEAFENIRKKVRVLSEQEFCKRRKQEECDKYVDCETCLIDSVIQIVSEVEAEYGNGWIPCSERLPEDNTRVLACFSSGTVTELAYLGEGMFSGLYEYTTKVIIAWMPLPEPYKPGKGGVVMKQISICRNCEYSGRESDEYPCETCHHYENFKQKKQFTNGDKIRSMSDEELAEFFNQHDCVCDFCNFNMGCLQHETVRCKEGFLNWLKSPTTD